VDEKWERSLWTSETICLPNRKDGSQFELLRFVLVELDVKCSDKEFSETEVAESGNGGTFVFESGAMFS